TDMRWGKALREEIMEINVDLRAKLLDVDLTLRDLMNMKAGDIIPVDMPENLLVYVEDLPSFRAQLGQANENLALKITERLKRPEVMKSELSLIRGSDKLLDEIVVLDDE
ncbi:MAG: FliM/FliN family flagellar motor switch protein, partial [Plesiomonas shigelloides]